MDLVKDPLDARGIFNKIHYQLNPLWRNGKRDEILVPVVP